MEEKEKFESCAPLPLFPHRETYCSSLYGTLNQQKCLFSPFIGVTPFKTSRGPLFFIAGKFSGCLSRLLSPRQVLKHHKYQVLFPRLDESAFIFVAATLCVEKKNLGKN